MNTGTYLLNQGKPTLKFNQHSTCDSLVMPLDSNENSYRRKQLVFSNSIHRSLPIPTHQLFSIFKVFSTIAIDVKFGEKSLCFVCDKNDAKQHKLNQNSLLKSPKLQHKQHNKLINVQIPFSAW